MDYHDFFTYLTRLVVGAPTIPCVTRAANGFCLRSRPRDDVPRIGGDSTVDRDVDAHWCIMRSTRRLHRFPDEPDSYGVNVPRHPTVRLPLGKQAEIFLAKNFIRVVGTTHPRWFCMPLPRAFAIMYNPSVSSRPGRCASAVLAHRGWLRHQLYSAGIPTTTLY